MMRRIIRKYLMKTDLNGVTRPPSPLLITISIGPMTSPAELIQIWKDSCSYWYLQCWRWHAVMKNVLNSQSLNQKLDHKRLLNDISTKNFTWSCFTLSTVKLNQKRYRGLHVSGRKNKSYSNSPTKSARPKLPVSNAASKHKCPRFALPLWPGGRMITLLTFPRPPSPSLSSESETKTIEQSTIFNDFFYNFSLFAH